MRNSKTNYRFFARFSNFKFAAMSFWKDNQFFLCILIFLAGVGFFTGIFTCLRTGVTNTSILDYNLSILANGSAFSFDVFFSRMLSYTIILVAFYFSSLTVFVAPLGFALHLYKAYLIGFNCTLIFTIYGFSGIITNLIIIIPFQLICFLMCIIYFAIVIKQAKNRKKFGKSCTSGFLKVFFAFFAVLTILNIFECLLLSLINAKVIFII